MLKVIALALVGVAAVVAQVPHHCISPPELSFLVQEFNHEYTTFRHFDVQYDARERRIAMFERERRGTGVQYEWIIALHEEQIGYQINRKTKQCKKFKPGSFSPLEVPKDATLGTEFYIGGPGEEVEITEWFLGSKSSGFEWAGGFSRDNCYPCRTFVKNNRNNHTLTNNIYNLVEGITDPDRFIPPPECESAIFEAPSKTFWNMLSWFAH